MFEYEKEDKRATHKHIIELDMSDYENQMVLNRYVKSLDMAMAISAIIEMLRGKVKYTEKVRDQKLYQALREEICGILDKYSIEIDDLVC